MATQAKKQPIIAVPKEQVWYIASTDKEFVEGNEYYPELTVEKAIESGSIDVYDIPRPQIHIFEVKYAGTAQVNITIKK